MMQHSRHREAPPDWAIMARNASEGNRFPKPSVFGILIPDIGELGVESGVER